MADQLSPVLIEEITEILSWEDMSIIAIQNLGFEMHELINIRKNKPDPTEFIRKVLNDWRTKAGQQYSTKQVLADILYDSKMVDHRDIKDILSVDRSENKLPVEFSKKKSKNGSAISKLGKLATEISKEDMETIAMTYLDFKYTDIQDRKSDRDGAWWFKLGILATYAKRADSTAEGLCKILEKSHKVFMPDVQEILRKDDNEDQTDVSRHVGHSQTMASSQIEGKTPQSSEGTNERKTQEQKQETEKDSTDGNSLPREPPAGKQTGRWTFEDKIFAGGIALGVLCILIVVIGTFAGNTSGAISLFRGLLCVGARIYRRGEDSHIAGSSKFLLSASETFPHGLQSKKPHDYYEFLKFSEIRQRTEPWKDKTPVRVAVLDTGIYEDHKDLKGKILTEQSKSFLPDADSKYLQTDKQGHGTMVAGIIAGCGPHNVEMINIQVMGTDGKYDTDTLVKALKYVRDLRLPDGRGVDIINMSLGQIRRSLELDDMLDSFKDKILVAAAGNDGAQSTDPVYHPAKHQNVIAVGAHNIKGVISDLSPRDDDVKFLCPGEHVVSTATQYKDGILPRFWNYILGLFGLQHLYFSSNGTSFASPYATAVIAHILAMEGLHGADHRKLFCSKNIMAKVLRRLSDDPGVLRAYEKGFKKINMDLKSICVDILER